MPKSREEARPRRPAKLPVALRLAANHSGNSDSTASICGQLLGALHGERALPGNGLPETGDSYRSRWSEFGNCHRIRFFEFGNCHRFSRHHQVGENR
jgi:hypothetical protein